MSDMEETAERPKWLLELENRKRKPRLAHEAGAGAPCMVCSTACPGLDLHFWRKICKNCKCGRDDHDFDDDDFPQFDMLFGSSKKYKRKPILLHVNNEKQHEGEAAFEWVPPDTTMELATDYMKALPLEKLPIKGSAGAALRKQLLQKQLPLHDIDHKACDELTEQEKKQFETYLENIKKYVGQGKVTKILGARPFDRSLMTPANATDMQRFSPQHKPNTPTSTIQLRTPSSFTTKSSYAKNLYKILNQQDPTAESETIRKIPVLEKYNILNNCNSEVVKSEPIKSGIYNQNCHLPNTKLDNHRRDTTNKSVSTSEEYPNYSNPSAMANIANPATIPWNHPDNITQGHNDILRNPAMGLAHSSAVNENAKIAESILADAFLPPSTIHANDIIGSTLDEKGLMFIREKLTDKYSNQESQVPHIAPNVSRDLDASDLLRRNHATRNTSLSGNVDKANERTAIMNAMKNPPGTSTLSEEGIKRAQNDKVEGKPIVAETDLIKPNSQTVQSVVLDPTLINNRNEKNRFKENLSGTRGMVFHSPSRLTGTPDRLPQVPIFSNNSSSPTPEHPAKLSSSTVASNIIHSEQLNNQIFPHVAIDTVNQQVQNLPNIEHLRGAVEELSMDSHNVKPQKCHNCEEEIRVGDVVVVTEKAKNATWHPGCFVCSMCNELLVDLVYFHYKNKLYCGRDLATLLGIPRCFACDELIFVREYTVAEGHNYHVKHFCCWDCDVPLAGQQYITENDRPLCLPCYQKTYAKTCNACEKVIAADQQGVAVKNLNFHASEECFCCHTCKKKLLNGRMAVKEEKLFCSTECISQFLHPQT